MDYKILDQQINIIYLDASNLIKWLSKYFNKLQISDLFKLVYIVEKLVNYK